MEPHDQLATSSSFSERNAVIVPERLVGDQIAEARVGSGTPGMLENDK